MSSKQGSSAGRGAIRALALTSILLFAAPSFGEEGQPAGGASDLAALLQDPLATLAAIGTDNRAFFRSEEDNDEAFLSALQPVYSLPFEDQGFVLIPRLNIPIISLKPGLDIPRLGDDGSINASGNAITCNAKKRFKVASERKKSPRIHSVSGSPIVGIAPNRLIITWAPQ